MLRGRALCLKPTSATDRSRNRVAEDGDGRLLGWALSVARDGLLELTHFFVDPASQACGIGRGLLERAFPLGRGRARAILATQDPRALSPYLKFGVGYAGMTAELYGSPRQVEVETDLQIERVGPGGAMVAEIGAIAGAPRRATGRRKRAGTSWASSPRRIQRCRTRTSRIASRRSSEASPVPATGRATR